MCTTKFQACFLPVAAQGAESSACSYCVAYLSSKQSVYGMPLSLGGGQGPQVLPRVPTSQLPVQGQCAARRTRHTSERSSQPSACLFAPLKPGTSSTSRKRNLTESGSCQLLIPACCCYCKLPGSAMTVQQRPLVSTLTSASVICQPWVKQWKTLPRTDLNDHEADCLAHRPSGFVISHAVSSNHSMLRQLCLSGFDPSSNWEFPT